MDRVFIVSHGIYGLGSDTIKVFRNFKDAEELVMYKLNNKPYDLHTFGGLNIYCYRSYSDLKYPYAYFGIETMDVE